jgi:nucleoside-diphosphate-sugar epimerase
MPRNVALVAGSNGVVGRALSELLVSLGGWDVIALSRRSSPMGVTGRPAHVDLRDRGACIELGRTLGEVTHLFYCARATSPDPFEEERVNLAMLTNIVDAIEANAPNLAHIQAMQGTKWYGCHLGPYKTPACEDDPRHFPPNFYFAQHDFLTGRQREAAWTFSALRPHTVWGIVHGYPHSFVVLLSAFATLCRHLKLPLIFPGSAACFDSVSQATDARLLAEAMVWAATTGRCANNAFNVVNGDLFRWRHLWPKIAAFFDLEAGPVQTMRLCERMADKEAVWAEIVRAHGLRPTRFSDLGDWSYFDFTLRFDSDDISATTKARAFGFDRTVDTEESLMRFFRQLRDMRTIP